MKRQENGSVDLGFEIWWQDIAQKPYRPLTRGNGTALKLAVQTAPHVRLRMASAKRNIRCKAYTWAGHRES